MSKKTASFCGLLFIYLFVISLPAEASLEVGGVITQNTNWTMTDSPVNLAQDLLVSRGVTLKIEPGVIVNYNYRLLQVDGVLAAQGLSDNPIIFNGPGQLLYNVTSPSYNPAADQGAKLSFVDVRTFLSVSTYFVSIRVTRCNFTDAANIVLDHGSSYVDYNSFRGDNASAAITIKSQSDYYGRHTISHNSIIGYLEGIYVEAGVQNLIVEYNTIQTSYTGIYCDQGSSPTIWYNSIVGSKENAIWVNNGAPIVNYNNLYGSRYYDFRVSGKGGVAINAKSNWWGTADRNVIADHIYDYEDDAQLDRVIFDPVLGSREGYAPDPIPIIDSMDPIGLCAGSSDFTLTINGSGFALNSIVSWNGTAKTTTFINPTQLTALIPASDIAVAGTANVTVVNPVPGGGTSNIVGFKIRLGKNPDLTLSSLQPSTATSGEAGFILTAVGKGFSEVTRIRWNGSDRITTFISETQLTATIDAADILRPGTASISVFDPSFCVGSSNSLSFNITVGPPTLISISPTHAEAGGDAFTLTAIGANFVESSIIHWDGSSRPTHYVSENRLTADISANDIAIGGIKTVAVLNPVGQFSNTKAVHVTVCSYSIAPQVVGFDAGGGSGSVSVDAPSDCGWKASTTASWISIQSGVTGWGDGIVSYRVALNTGVRRQATLAVAGRVLTITQEALSCSYRLNPVSRNFGEAGGAGSISILDCESSCPWQADSDATWITITGSSAGSGNGMVSYVVARNTGSQRQGAITIGGQLHTVVQAGATCIAQRILPTYYAAGQSFQVTIKVTPPSSSQIYAIEEYPPDGWPVSAISHGGSWDSVNKKVKWGPFLDLQPRNLQYTVTPPAGATGTNTFAGLVAFDMNVLTICGSTKLPIGNPHPADVNGDWRLSVDEITAYGSCWKTGCTWGVARSDIPIDYLTNASLIWKNGESYHFDPAIAPPGCWVSGIASGQPAVAEITALSSKKGTPGAGAITGLPDRRAPVPGGHISIIGTGMRISQSGFGTAISSFSPAAYTPGNGVLVNIVVTPGSATQVYAVEDSPPVGWVLTNINNSGSYDGNAKKVKWGPFFDNTVRTLAYIATPPDREIGAKTFTGVASFDGKSVAIGGRRAIDNCCASVALAVGLGQFGTTGGWISTHASKEGDFATQSWIRLPWSAYNAKGGGIHVATGDVDGDLLDELVLGLGAGSGGWIAIMDDNLHANALLKWIRIEWSDYDASNGEVYPAVGDLNGDGAAEIVAGLGTGGKGWIEIFGNASTGYRHLEWRQVSWADYNSRDGSVHPAVGDLDGDGASEIILGLATGGGGRIEVLQSAAGNYAHLSWLQVDWPDYNSSNGTSWPAVGDLDGDGRAEVIIGLGQGSSGWVEILDDQVAAYATLKWVQIPWDAYNAANGETHPAAGNLDTDSRAEIVFGLGRFNGNGGWLCALDDIIANYAFLGWFRVPSIPFATDGGETFPSLLSLH